MASTVLYTAAHAGFDLTRVPLGGGATISHQLVQTWTQTLPFPFRVLSPELMGLEAPRDKDLVTYSELRYAQFARAFEKCATEAILKEDPKKTVVLSNDISEGPDFRRLAERGYRVFTIFHVDVVDYMARLYLKGWVQPETTSRFYAALESRELSHWVPDVLKLVWQKQQHAVRYSSGLIVPSAAMKDVLLRSYPGTPAGKIHVIPWGIWPADVSPPNDSVGGPSVSFMGPPPIPAGDDRIKLLTLSRISPEKGQDRLLKALAQWETRDDYPAEGVTLMLCGEAAYMQGRAFMKKLRRLATRLKRTQVIFPGYVSGARKQEFFDQADLYVFPSRHESYGLTLLEALQAGLPVVACANHGTEDIVQSDFGRLVQGNSERERVTNLSQTLSEMVLEKGKFPAMKLAARAYAAQHSFSDSAARLASLLQA